MFADERGEGAFSWAPSRLTVEETAGHSGPAADDQSRATRQRFRFAPGYRRRDHGRQFLCTDFTAVCRRTGCIPAAGNCRIPRSIPMMTACHWRWHGHASLRPALQWTSMLLWRSSDAVHWRRQRRRSTRACVTSLTGFMMEQPLADVRTALATLGFARIGAQTMVEDHLQRVESDASADC